MHINLGTNENHRRARYMFPGQIFNEQELRKRHERKFRDWDGWLKLVAEYHKEALLGNEPAATQPSLGSGSHRACRLKSAAPPLYHQEFRKNSAI